MQNRLSVLSFSDLHARRDNIDKVDKALSHIIEIAKEKKPDLIAFCGDLWDGAVEVNQASPLYTVVDQIRRLSAIAPVYILQGTPSHDRPGSLDILEKVDISDEGNIFVLRQPTRLADQRRGPKYLIMPVPGLTKSYLQSWATQQGIALSPDEADNEASALLKNIFLGFQAKLAEARKQNPDIIPILLGHLTVAGSRTSTGQTMVGGDIVISPNDLAMAGGVINLLGHIHLPQDGDGYHYCGSPFAVNWGEQEEKSMIYAELSPGGIEEMERIAFPFPPMVDIEYEYIPSDDPSVCHFKPLSKHRLADCVGAEVRCRVHVSPDAKDIIPDDWFEGYLWGALGKKALSVKFEKIITQTNRQRCEIITKAATNADRLTAWAETTETDIPDGANKKLDSIEEQADLVERISTQKKDIKLKSLKLRGAKGIKWTDEIEIDFTRFEPGMIDFDADNGAGKTTIFDNLSPYPFCPYRDGISWNAKISDHFRLEDSRRELVVEINGIGYKFLIIADGVRGRAEYHAFKSNGVNGWEPINDGKKPSYKEKVLDLFGDPELYLQTVYQVQESKGLIGKTNAEMKAMFYELLGFGGFQAIADKAKESAGTLKLDIGTLESNISEASGQVEAIPETEKAVADIENDLTRIRSLKQASEAELEYQSKKLKEAEAAVTLQDEGQRQLMAKKQSLREMAAELQTAVSKFTGWKPRQEVKIADLEKAITETNNLVSRADEIGRMAKLQREGKDLKERVDDNCYKLDAMENDLKRVISERDREIERANNRIQVTEKSIANSKKLASPIGKVPCQNLWRPEYERVFRGCDDRFVQSFYEICDKCPLLSQAQEAKTGLAELESELEKQKTHPDFITKQYEPRISALDDNAIKLRGENEGLAREEDTFDSNPDRNKLSKADWEKLSANLDVAAAKRGGLDTQLVDAKAILEEQTAAYDKAVKDTGKRIESLKGEIAKLEPSINKAIFDRHDKLAKEYEALKANINSMVEQINDLTAAKAGKEERLKSLLGIQAKTLEHQKKLTGYKSDYAEYVLLQRAFSRDGVPALLLENALPQIAETANDMLSQFGTGLQLRFDTLRDKADGKGQKDTFEIIIIDESGEKRLEDLSGGEKPPVIIALQTAIGIYRSQQTGYHPRYAIVDECDGALRDHRAEGLIDAFQKRMELADLDHLLFVTHRKELADQVDQKIVLDTEAGHIVEAF